VLRTIAMSEVWGAGKRMKAHLEAINIHTAMDLVRADGRTLRDRLSVVIEKTARELAGTPCLEPSEAEPPR
jgi:DNA polymerase V